MADGTKILLHDALRAYVAAESVALRPLGLYADDRLYRSAIPCTRVCYHLNILDVCRTQLRKLRDVHNLAPVDVYGRRAFSENLEVSVAPKHHRNLRKDIVCRACMFKLRAYHIGHKGVALDCGQRAF